jgi:hypothetical protein
MNRFSWTTQRIEELKRLAAEGLTCQLIGDTMGLSKNAVVGKLHRLGIKFRGPTLGKPHVEVLPKKPRLPSKPKIPQSSMVLAVNDPLRLHMQRALSEEPKPAPVTTRPSPQRSNFGTILVHRHNRFNPGADELYAELAQAAANTLKLQNKLVDKV